MAAIAERVGIPVDGIPVDASALSEDEGDVLTDALAAASVFGRVRPGHKLAAVRALQAGGHVVAMVGDGVNDVQALKQADLGIAMGSGSQASRSVARVVLLDGTFAAIPRMLDEGRRVIALVAAMAGVLVLLFAVPPARRILALELPPVSVCAWTACVVLAAITGLTLWRRVWWRQSR